MRASHVGDEVFEGILLVAMFATYENATRLTAVEACIALLVAEHHFCTTITDCEEQLLQFR